MRRSKRETRSLQSRARPGAVILLVVTLAIAGWAYRNWSRYRTANADAALSKQVLDSSERLLSNVLDAETGQRGFLLTGEDRYLEPYNQASNAVPRELTTLAALVGRNSAQTADVDRLKVLAGQKMSELAEAINF